MARRFSCAALWVVLAVLLSGPGVPFAEAQLPQTCAYHPCIIDMSSSTYVMNNLWNTGGATGTQSVTVTSSTSWSTTWDWNRPEEWSVTTYAASVTGWQWGWHYPASQTGLPIQLSSHTPVNTSLAYNYVPDASCGSSRTCRVDLAYDLWFHTTSNPGTRNPVFELMIWTAYSRELWVGYTPAGFATIGGHSWKVIQVGSTSAAFVIDEPDLTAIDLNLTDFTDWMVTNLGMPASWWLDSVEFGPEVYKGRGTLNVTSYTISVGAHADPPPPEGFTVGTTTVSPSQVATGQNAAITTQVTSSSSAAKMIVDLEIYNANNVKVGQQIFTGQSFSAGQARSFTWNWSTGTEGAYMVKVGVFSPNWRTVYAWDNDAAPFSVAGAPTAFAVTSTTASPDPVSRGRRLTITTYVRGTAAATGVQLDVEVHSATGLKVAEKLCTVNFAAGQTQSCTYKLLVTQTLPVGLYTVSVGVLNTDKTQLYTWVDTADTFTVK
jgi:Glycosyl hydrolase family 12